MELDKLMLEAKLKGVPMLVLANKSDLIGAATAEKVLFVFKVAVHLFLFNLPTIVYGL